MLKTRIVICPKCDEEQKVSINVKNVKCKFCGKEFIPHKLHIEPHRHFHHHPLNCANF